MENASKALLMAAGILIGMLLLSFMVVLFSSSRNVAKGYEETKQTEAVQQFNSNFTKYLGQELTIHQVVTICNFAKDNNVTINSGKTIIDLKSEINVYTSTDVPKYKIQKIEYDENNGRIKAITFKKI